MFKNSEENAELLGDCNVCFGAKLLGNFHTFNKDCMIYKCEKCKFAICDECFEKISEAHNKEKEIKRQQSITVDMLGLKEKDLVKTSVHKHCLQHIKGIDHLCTMVLSNECIAINGTFKNTKNISNYFKCSQGCNFIICDYCASSYYISPADCKKPKKKSQTSKRTCMIF